MKLHSSVVWIMTDCLISFPASLSPWICSSWFFINHSAKTISGWTLVAVPMERTLLVYWPLKARTITARKYTFAVTVSICFFCSIIYIHYFGSYGRKYEVIDGEKVLTATCTVNAEGEVLSYYMTYIRPYQDLLIRSAIPFLFLLVCNILIIARLAHQQKTKRAKMKSTDEETNKRKEAQMKSITAMLLAISFTHLICIAPMQIMYIVDGSDPFGWTITEQWQAEVALRWGFAISVYYLNHAINCILYIVSSSEFRKDVLQLWIKVKKRMKCFNNQVFPKSNATTSAHSAHTGTWAHTGCTEVLTTRSLMFDAWLRMFVFTCLNLFQINTYNATVPPQSLLIL